jgi:hypothetical protein
MCEPSVNDCPAPYTTVTYTERVYNFDGTRWVADLPWFVIKRRTDVRVGEITPQESQEYRELSPIIAPANPWTTE